MGPETLYSRWGVGRPAGHLAEIRHRLSLDPDSVLDTSLQCACLAVMAIECFDEALGVHLGRNCHLGSAMAAGPVASERPEPPAFASLDRVHFLPVWVHTVTPGGRAALVLP